MGSTLTRNNKVIGILMVLLIAVGIPLTILLVKQRQIVEQQALGEQALVYFSTDGVSPTTDIAIPPQETVDLPIYVDTENYTMTGFDITIDLGTGVTLEQLHPNDALGGSILPENQDQNLRIVRHGRTIPDSTLEGKQRLATLTLKAASNPPSGIITISGVTIISTLAQNYGVLTTRTIPLRYAVGTPNASLHFTNLGSDTPLTSLTIQPNTSLVLKLTLDVGSAVANSFAVWLSYPESITVERFEEGADANKFNATVLKDFNNTTRLLRYEKLSNTNNAAITGKLHLATITFKAKEKGAGRILFSKAVATGTTPIILTTKHLNFAIGASPSNTPVPTGEEPTLTPRPTQSECPEQMSLQGVVFHDVNRNRRQDPSEEGLPNIYVLLLGAVDASQVTDDDGIYLFENLDPGDYQIEITVPQGFTTLSDNPYAITNLCADTLTVNFALVPAATISPTISPPISPSVIPTPSILPGRTYFDFRLFLQGTGRDGATGQPQEGVRTLLVEVFDTDNTLVAATTGAIGFDRATEKFKGIIDMGLLRTGKYLVKVTTDRYLRKLISQKAPLLTIQENSINGLPEATLVVGDVNNDNVLNLLDYNILAVACFDSNHPTFDPKAKFNSRACTTHPQRKTADLNDDGFIDGKDFNLLIRSFSMQRGD